VRHPAAMTDSPYAIPAEDLVAGARVDRADQVEVQALLEPGAGDWSPGTHPFGDGAGGDVDGDGD
jgi:hypothetical protein